MRRIWAAFAVAWLVAGCGLFGRNPNPGGPDDSGNLVPYPSGYTAPPSSTEPVADFTFPPPRTTQRPVVTLGPNDTPAPTLPEIQDFLTATASIANVGDDPVGVTVWIRDTTNAKWVQVIAETLQSGDAHDQELAPATYSVAFTWNGRPQETCNLEVTDGNTIVFTVLEQHVVITKSDFKATSGEDLDVATSPVCQAPVS